VHARIDGSDIKLLIRTGVDWTPLLRIEALHVPGFARLRAMHLSCSADLIAR